MYASSDGVSPTPGRQRRQRTGSACEECRRRKLRCDGQQPQCGVCQESGEACEINTNRAFRGPKKGYLKALRNRVAVLESGLNVAPQPAGRGLEPKGLPTPLTDLQPQKITRSSSVSEPESCLPSRMTRSNPLPGCSKNSNNNDNDIFIGSNIHVSELMQAELDQLYFERVHPSIPILHRRRYMSYSKDSVKRPSRKCLQYAIWTLATLLSAQFRHLQESLYQETKQMLESLSLSSSGRHPLDTEQVQAWVLVATYESMRTYHMQAWMSVGRAIRLVQLWRLHEIDIPTTASSLKTEVTETEEQRKVFWMVYFLDHLFSMRNNWPITLSEHMICTRLPAPEEDFQNGQPMLGDFLSEAIIDCSPRRMSLFNECVIFATICGRTLFHGQQYNARRLYGDVAPEWPDMHLWLDSILKRRLQALSQCYPSPTESEDPMLLFASTMGQATIIHLCKGMESAFPALRKEAALVVEHHQQALAAAEQIVNLAKALAEFHFFKVHPLIPLPLLFCAEFLWDNRSSLESFNLRLQDLMGTFRQLKNVNNPQQSYMYFIEQSCTSASATLAKEN